MSLELRDEEACRDGVCTGGFDPSADSAKKELGRAYRSACGVKLPSAMDWGGGAAFLSFLNDVAIAEHWLNADLDH